MKTDQVGVGKTVKEKNLYDSQGKRVELEMWERERERERNGDVCSDWGNSAIPVLLLAMDKSAVMGWTVWEGKRPIKGDGKRVPFAEAGSVFVTFLSVLQLSLLASSSLLLASLSLWPVSQLQVCSLSLSLSLSNILFFHLFTTS